jgi:hypothetical protein
MIALCSVLMRFASGCRRHQAPPHPPSPLRASKLCAKLALWMPTHVEVRTSAHAAMTIVLAQAELADLHRDESPGAAGHQPDASRRRRAVVH